MSSNKQRQDKLFTLFDLSVEALIQKIKAGEATSGDISAAIRLLKDNGIEVIPTGDDPLSELTKELQDVEFTDDHLQH